MSYQASVFNVMTTTAGDVPDSYQTHTLLRNAYEITSRFTEMR